MKKTYLFIIIVVVIILIALLGKSTIIKPKVVEFNDSYTSQNPTEIVGEEAVMNMMDNFKDAYNIP